MSIVRTAPFIHEVLRLEVLKATNEARFWDAYQLALTAGPLEQWTGAEAKLLAARLARHLGGNKLYWRLTAQAWREQPRLARFQTQRVYALVDRCGTFAAWQAARQLDRAEIETTEEQADALICQGFCQVVFRDFEAAQGFFARAQALAPQQAWVWSESSALPAERGEYEAALELVDQALSLEPFFRSALQRKAHYLQSLRRDDEAVALLEASCQHLQSAAVIQQLIVAYSEQEEWSRILNLLDEAERLSPYAEEGGRSWFSARRTDALLGLGQVPEAVVQARRVTKIKFYENLAHRLENSPRKGQRVKIPVPFIQQDYNTCAPATLSAITTFFGNPIPQDTLIGEVCYDGTFDFVERRWAQKAGWHAQEFKVTWDVAVALLDRGIPFVLSTQEINSGHSQAVIGYDTTRRTLLIRDPGNRHYTEYGYEEFEKHYTPVGPRGFLLLPASHLAATAGITLPEADLYDLNHALNCALDGHDRDRAEELLQQLHQQAPDHRLTWVGRRALAHYDQNPLAHLEAIDGLLKLFPEDDRLIYGRLQLLRNLGRIHEARELIKKRCGEKDVPPLFWREYAQELRQEKNKTGISIRLVQKSLKWNPRDVESLTILAGILWTIQNRSEALRIQRLAVCVGEKREPAADDYFQMQDACGQTESGLGFLKQRFHALIDKSSASAITLANALDRLKRSTEVRQVLKEALARRPQDGDLYLRLAQLEAACGQLDASRSFLEQAAPHTREIAWLRGAGNLERLIGNFDLSLEHWEKIVALSPLDLEAHRQIAWLLARRDGKASAQNYVRMLGQRFPQHRGLLELELGWLNADAPEDVEQRVIAYLQNHPTDAWARREYVLTLRNRQVLEEALVQAQEAVQYEPYQAASWQIQASVLESLNRTSAARDHLRHALTLNIDSAYAIRRLVFLADSMGEKQDALQFIQQELDRQSTSGPAISIYREVAFPILEMSELTENLRKYWKQRPDLWESWHTLLHQLIATGELNEAAQLAADATERFPTLPIVWRNAATLNQRLGALPEAVTCLLHALRINPDWVPVICDLAEMYRRLSQFKEARELLERSHRRNPLEAPLLGTLADLLWYLGEQETAFAQVRQAVETDSSYHWGWTTLAHWSNLLHQKNMALEMARERAQRLGKDATAWLRVSQLAQRPELAGERLQAAQRARECEPRNVDAHDAVASALAEQRRFDEAVQACHPNAFGGRTPVFLRGREAWLFAQQNKMPEAMSKMRAVVATDPHYLWGWDRLTDWYFSANCFTDSLNACEKVVRLSPMNAVGYGKRARAYEKVAKPKEARLDYQRALALDPSYTFAGWQLFQLHLGEKAFAAAEETLSLMRPHTSPGVMLPSEMMLAGKQRKWDEALRLLQQVALLLEVDTGVVPEALKLLDAGNQQKKVNKLLTSLIANADLNPYIANIWADRIGLVTKWNLFSYLKKIPANSRALETVLQNVILGSKQTQYPVRLVNRVVARFPQATRKHTQVWAVVGQIYATASSWRNTAEWLKDWESRPDAQGWMVTNLVFALQILGRIPEADAVSQKLLSRGLRDHAAAYHLIYLALSALERQDTEQARELLKSVHLESEHTHDQFFKLTVEQALRVQEAEPGPERRGMSAQARHQIARLAMPDLKVRRVLKAEARAALQMARDAGSFSAWVYAIRINMVARLVPPGVSSLGSRYVWIIVFLVITNSLRMCATGH